MALSDIYTQKAWTPAGDSNALINEGLGTAAEAYNQYQNRHSDAFKRHLEAVLNGEMDPTDAAASLKQHIAQNSGPAQPQPGSAFGGGAGSLISNVPQAGGPMTGPQAAPVNMGQQSQPVNMGPSALSGMQSPGMPQVSVTRGPMAEPMRQPMNAAGAFAAQRPASPPMQAPQAPQAQQAFADAPQQRSAPSNFIQTDADARSAMGLLPYAQAKKAAPKGPGRDFMGEIRARGDEARRTESTRQEGRTSLMDMRNAEKQVEQAAELAYKNDTLDERSAFHMEEIKLGYARLRSMERMLDTNIDYKREAGADEMLKTARTVVDSMTASEGALIGSAFARTPEGQVMLTNLHHNLGIWQDRLNSYGTGERTPAPTTSSTEKKVTRGGADNNRPAGPVPQPNQPAAKIRFKLKADTSYGKKGQTGSVAPDKFDASVMERIGG